MVVLPDESPCVCELGKSLQTVLTSAHPLGSLSFLPLYLRGKAVGLTGRP